VKWSSSLYLLGGLCGVLVDYFPSSPILGGLQGVMALWHLVSHVAQLVDHGAYCKLFWIRAPAD
jgi:hypothetical protein